MGPASLKPRTRMPTFFPDGVSQRPELLGGSVDHQIGAMWTYLSDLTKQPLPQQIQASRAASYVLKPTDRPLLLRTFVPGAGTHAIAVGFHEGVHFAFDAERSSLAVAWRNDFLDAQGTWFVRSAPPAIPLGSDVVKLTPRPLIVSLPSPDAAWPAESNVQFDGYRLDSSGTPTFMYHGQDFSITDTIRPGSESLLQRTIKVTRLEGMASQLYLSNHNRDDGVSVSIKHPVVIPHQAKVPLSFATDDNETIIELVYQW